MFWLIRKIFWIGVLVAIVYYGSNYQLDGKPVKQYVREFFDSPLVQSAIKAGKEEIQDFLNHPSSSSEPAASKPSAQTSSPTVKSSGDSQNDDQLTDEDRKALDQVMEKQTR